MLQVIRTRLLQIEILLFSSSIEEYVDFVPFSVTSGGTASFGPIGPALEGHGSTSPVNAYMYVYTYII